MSDQNTPGYRPSVHFTPKNTWMNDPNGLVLHKEQYHLFFQNNPFGKDWGNLSWGHAVSEDLLQWRELPVAIAATAEEMVFSGSVVWDRDNSSGLGGGGEGPLVAIYTSAHTDQDQPRAGRQAQSVAFSNDDGMTWTRYPGNPVLDRGSREFRDPKVFWHEESDRWVMVSVEAVDRQVLVHSSRDLLSWSFESAFGPVGEVGGVWECPDLIQVPIEGTLDFAWVMLVSLNPGGPAGGSGMQYFVGNFDGHTFSPGPEGARWLDFGTDFYAAVSFHGIQPPTIVGWMSNWAYAGKAPTHPWRSAMSLPRTLSLVATPSGRAVRQRLVLPSDGPKDVLVEEFVLDVDHEVALQWGEGVGASRLLLHRDQSGRVTADRTGADPHRVHVGFHQSAGVDLGDGPVNGLLVEDHGLVEVLLDDGVVSISMQTFPVEGAAPRLVHRDRVQLAARSTR